MRVIWGRFIYSVSHPTSILFLMVSAPILGAKNTKIKRRVLHPWELLALAIDEQINNNDSGWWRYCREMSCSYWRTEDNVGEGLSIQSRWRSAMSGIFRNRWYIKGESFRELRRAGGSRQDARHGEQGSPAEFRDLKFVGMDSFQGSVWCGEKGVEREPDLAGVCMPRWWYLMYTCLWVWHLVCSVSFS